MRTRSNCGTLSRWPTTNSLWRWEQGRTVELYQDDQLPTACGDENKVVLWNSIKMANYQQLVAMRTRSNCRTQSRWPTTNSLWRWEQGRTVELYQDGQLPKACGDENKVELWNSIKMTNYQQLVAMRTRSYCRTLSRWPTTNSLWRWEQGRTVELYQDDQLPKACGDENKVEL